MAFKVDKRDMDFILKEVQDINKILALEPYKDFSVEDIDMTLTQAVKFAVGKVAPLNKSGDKEGAKFEQGIGGAHFLERQHLGFEGTNAFTDLGFGVDRLGRAGAG